MWLDVDEVREFAAVDNAGEPSCVDDSRVPSLQAGFSILELSVVMVIIGLILSAVMSGRDVLSSAEGRKGADFINTWAEIQWEHFRRYGRFAGDSTSPGIPSASSPNPPAAPPPDRLIDDPSLAGTPGLFYCVDRPTTAVFDCDVDPSKKSDIRVARGFTTLPGDRTDATHLVVGSNPLFLSMGVDVDGTWGNSYNVIIVTNQRHTSGRATSAISDDTYLSYLAQIDTALDGADGAGVGRVRAISGPTPQAASLTLTHRTYVGEILQASGAASWTNNPTIHGLVYYFDRPLP
ncbi:MAG: prepilin-type N-terminal cleavage/methylation domain-containing protein [Magnetococcales bacterium]|nr:prepilin-type N-terminal cleavage/methylation domain-containing protein [Magnetococcales bacterium]